MNFAHILVSASGLARLAVTAAIITVGGALPVHAESTLERIARDGVVKIGYRQDVAPFSFDENGEARGYTVDLCSAVVGYLGLFVGRDPLAITFVPVSSASRFDAVVNGDIDLECGSTTATLSRRERVSFSIPIFVTGVVGITRADAPPELLGVLRGEQPLGTLSEPPLADLTFGAVAGTTAVNWVAAISRGLKKDEEVIVADDYGDALDRLASGEIDVLFGDEAIFGKRVASPQSPGRFTLGTALFSFEPYAITLPRGDEDFRLAVDRALSQIYQSGEIERIHGRHMGRISDEALGLLLMTSLPE